MASRLYSSQFSGQPALLPAPPLDCSLDKCLPKVVSLFCGAGGLDWGFKKEGFKIGLAFDVSEAAIQTHRRNFPRTKAIACDLEKAGPEGVLRHVMERIPPGTRIGVIGGPPCQGFSRANTRASKNDKRNKLPQLYLRIVEALQTSYKVEFIVFENVVGMRDEKHRPVYKRLISGLKRLNLNVVEQELCALEFGVPQIRHRIILTATARAEHTKGLRPRRRRGAATVRDAINGLPPPTFYSRGLSSKTIPFHPNHWTMKPKSKRFNGKMATKDVRSFKRLVWNKPSPTIAFGNREIHVHPDGQRRLSLYEAMLLQGFPKQFVLEGNLSQQVEQISNAVPPPLARSVASSLRRALRKIGRR